MNAEAQLGKLAERAGGGLENNGCAEGFISFVKRAESLWLFASVMMRNIFSADN